MFLAPFSVPTSSAASPVRAQPLRSRAVPSAGFVPAGLLAWFALGLLLVLGVPALRGGEHLGATLPFWLVAAPLINLAWLLRRRAAHALVRAWQRVVTRRRRQCGGGARKRSGRLLRAAARQSRSAYNV